MLEERRDALTEIMEAGLPDAREKSHSIGPKRHHLRAPTPLDTSRITRLLRPCLSNLLAIRDLIEADIEENLQMEPMADVASAGPTEQHSTIIGESPVFKFGRSLANKSFRRYGRTGSRTMTSQRILCSSSDDAEHVPAGEAYQFEETQYLFLPSNSLSTASQLGRRIVERLMPLASCCTAIGHACYPTSADQSRSTAPAKVEAPRPRGVPSLMELSAAVVGAHMDEWIADVAHETNGWAPMLKGDSSYLQAQERCYGDIPAQLRSHVLAPHCLAMLLTLPKHPSLVPLLQSLSAQYERQQVIHLARLASMSVIPPPSILHPQYILEGRLGPVTTFRPDTWVIITSSFCRHLSTLNPIECFAESVQSFFDFLADKDEHCTGRAQILKQVTLCAAQMLERRQDEDGMWVMLDRWVLALEAGVMNEEARAVIGGMFAPLFRRHLSQSRGGHDRLQQTLLSLATLLLSPETAPHLTPQLCHPDLTAAAIPFISTNRLQLASLRRISTALDGAGLPYLEVRVLEALDSHPDILHGSNVEMQAIERRLVEAQRQCIQADGGDWHWDSELGEWVEPSPVKPQARRSHLAAVSSDLGDWDLAGDDSDVEMPQSEAVDASDEEEGDAGSHFSLTDDEEEVTIGSKTPSSPAGSEFIDSSFILATPSPAMSSQPSSSLLLGLKRSREPSSDARREANSILGPRKSVTFAIPALPLRGQATPDRHHWSSTRAPLASALVIKPIRPVFMRSSSEDPLDCLDAETPEHPYRKRARRGL